jgi:uncharacterized SAM-binding protein YcdF (DUF218 family)
MKVLVVLGSPNAPDGTLSVVAQSRLDLCYEQYCKEPGLILLTGGFGPHFNASAKPHAYYGKQYLVAKGVHEADFLAFAESANTVQDAVLAKALLEKYIPLHAVVITSDYHLARAQYIFERIFASTTQLTFMAASSDTVAASELKRYQEHETKALQDLYANGVRY